MKKTTIIKMIFFPLLLLIMNFGCYGGQSSESQNLIKVLSELNNKLPKNKITTVIVPNFYAGNLKILTPPMLVAMNL